MKIPENIRRIGRFSRAILIPIGDVSTHLKRLTRNSAKELGVRSEIIQILEALTDETCQECGFELTDNSTIE